MSRPEWIEVGRISRPHGVHGEVRIVPDSDNPDRFVPGAVVHARARHIGIAGPRLREQVRLTVETVRGDGDFPIVAFCEVPDRDAAESLRGYLLEVPSTQLPELDEDEFYPFDLEGLEVRDAQGGAIGTVVDLVESPAHAILVISLASGGEVMVPFVGAAVPTVTVAEGFLVVEPRFLTGGDQAE
ncbi:MAG: 16S rRNA processing protein RimM [Actinobacteria bacterium RBG_16_64_13]|nr:MAG: 16S rRNA processing protein RimM [Actinobacteria bacterium RBG_16_64_13]